MSTRAMPDESPHRAESCAEGWICEEHPDLAWPHDDCAGPGMLCRTRGCPFVVYSPHEVHDLLGGALHQLLTTARAYRAVWLRMYEPADGQAPTMADGVQIGHCRGALFAAVHIAEQSLAALNPQIPGTEAALQPAGDESVFDA